MVAKVRNGKDRIHSLEHGTVLYQDCGDGNNNLHVLKQNCTPSEGKKAILLHDN